MELQEYKAGLLRETVQDMAHIVIIQVQKSKQALFKQDAELPIEVLGNLRRVKLLKLKVDYDCRNFLALYNPVAIDLRFVLSILKITQSLDRIGNYTENICRLLEKDNPGKAFDLLEIFKINKMFDTAIQMLYNVQEAMENENPLTMEKIFSKEGFLNEANRVSDQLAIQRLERNASEVNIVLCMLDIVHKLEKIGDEAKSIGESIIFHLEAKVLRHAANDETL